MKLLQLLTVIIGWTMAVNITNSTDTIYAYISSQSNFSTLSSYIESAPAMKKLISSNLTNVTLFAPTNEALSLLPAWLSETLNSSILSTFFLAYHLTNDSWTAPSEPKNSTLTSFLDTNISVSVVNETFALANNKSNILGIIRASNGFILPIDHILSMNRTPVNSQ